MQIKVISSDNTERYIYGVNDAEYIELCDKVGYTGLNPKDYTTSGEPYLMSEFPDGTVSALVDTDYKMVVPNLWGKQETKIAENGAITKQYYQMESNDTTLPFTITGYDGTGQINERRVTAPIEGGVVRPLENGIDFQSELTTFASTHSLELPTHDITDTKIGMVSVDYNESTPTNINYHIDER